MNDRTEPYRLLLDQFTANAVQASRAARTDRSDETRAAHQAIAAVWTQAAHLLSQAIKQAADDTTPAEEGAADRRYWTTRYDRGDS